MNSERKYQYDQVYMRMAHDMAELSYAIRSKVGCVIVSEDGQLISQGFNGTPTGYDNCCENVDCLCTKHCIHDLDYIDPETCHNIYKCEHLYITTKTEVLHAESNAISKCAKWHSSTQGATLYVTLSPCMDCAKMIIQAGIKRVCYNEPYRDLSGVNFLEENGVEVEQIDI